MESWKQAWRAIVPSLTTAGLNALRQALLNDDGRLVQGRTTHPAAFSGRPELAMCEQACAVGYTGWQGDGLETVGEVEEYFAIVCFAADAILGETSLVRMFTNWFDETPRQEMRRELFPEVLSALADRLRQEGGDQDRGQVARAGNVLAAG